MKHKAFIDGLDLSSRQKRRNAAKLAACLVDRIHFEESRYMWRIPDNLKGGAAYDAAEETVDYLEDAIISLRSAYD